VHGHFPYANLFEGNIIQNYMIDHYWGPAGPYNTFFRNRTQLYGIIMTNSNGYDSNLQNLVGNEAPNTGLFMGNYIISGTQHIQHGNNIRGTVTPTGTGTVSDLSFYLTSTPDFWTNSGNWPTIGYPNAGNTGSIPAKVRYDAGGDITLCNDDFVTAVAENFSAETAIVAFPNPFSDGLSLYYFSEKAETIFISLQDVSGKTVFEKNTTTLKGENQIRIFETAFLSNGMYFLSVQTNEKIWNLKVLKY
jgi:hypothetical protein